MNDLTIVLVATLSLIAFTLIVLNFILVAMVRALLDIRNELARK